MAIRCIRQSLSYATSALMGVSSTSANAAESWEIDAGLMNYIEQDRNIGVEVLVGVKKLFPDGDELTFGLELDTLTGATPNGATPSNVAQTFTKSSGAGSYTTEAGKLPADDTHADTRLAIEAGYKNQHSSDLVIAYGGRLSMEFDYLSLGFGNSYQVDFDQHNTSLFFGLKGEYNRVHPVGSIPDPMALMTPPGTPPNRGLGAETRQVIEFATGLTQVIDRRSLFQLRFTRTDNSGYLNDPYKILSIIEDQDEPTLGSSLEYRFENRPDSRDINSLFFGYKRDMVGDVLDISVQHSEDDWDIESTTLELRYRYNMAGSAYIQPHIRWYRQQEAKFFYHSLLSSESLPENASADTRIAAFDAWTVGVRYGGKYHANSRYSFVVEYYTQNGESYPDDAVGLQTQQDLFPQLKTLIFKYIFSTK